jgi:hypothetical protein
VIDVSIDRKWAVRANDRVHVALAEVIMGCNQVMFTLVIGGAEGARGGTEERSGGQAAGRGGAEEGISLSFSLS